MAPSPGGRAKATRPRRMTDPRSWPVRWRLTVASSGLILAILVIFALVIGHLVSERIRDDFNDEMNDAVRVLASEVEIEETIGGPVVTGPQLDDFALPNDAVVRVFDSSGRLLDQTRNAPDLGNPIPGIAHQGSLRVITGRIVSAASGGVAGYIEYARSEQQVESSINRMWGLIAIGVFGAVLLAGLAGYTIASRAMRPIAALTAAAGEVADTRDPSRHMPQSDVDDEVGELARTLEQMLRSLDAARTERERAMGQQREFVADASHELRTPLTSVIANLELLQTSLAEGKAAENNEMVDSALRSSRRMNRLVGDLLLLARADAGRVSERSDCDLAEIGANAAAEIAPVADGRRLDVDDGTPVPVRGNPDELHRMVVNLLDNAVRHTPDGSTVRMHLMTERDSAVVEVADDGPGVPDPLRDQIFDRFTRGNGPADVSGVGGTGLGLAIVRAVARSHGGDVSVGDSSLGGAQFRVTLPLRET